MSLSKIINFSRLPSFNRVKMDKLDCYRPFRAVGTGCKAPTKDLVTSKAAKVFWTSCSLVGIGYGLAKVCGAGSEKEICLVKDKNGESKGWSYSIIGKYKKIILNAGESGESIKYAKCVNAPQSSPPINLQGNYPGLVYSIPPISYHVPLTYVEVAQELAKENGYSESGFIHLLINRQNGDDTGAIIFLFTLANYRVPEDPNEDNYLRFILKELNDIFIHGGDSVPALTPAEIEEMSSQIKMELLNQTGLFKIMKALDCIQMSHSD